MEKKSLGSCRFGVESNIMCVEETNVELVELSSVLGYKCKSLVSSALDLVVSQIIQSFSHIIISFYIIK